MNPIDYDMKLYQLKNCYNGFTDVQIKVLRTLFTHGRKFDKSDMNMKQIKFKSNTALKCECNKG